MASGPSRERVTAWVRDPLVRLLAMLALALAAAIASLVSFLYLGGSPGGTPSRIEMGLLVVGVAITFYVGITAGGT